jgi:hypothetical protein
MASRHHPRHQRPLPLGFRSLRLCDFVLVLLGESPIPQLPARDVKSQHSSTDSPVTASDFLGNRVDCAACGISRLKPSSVAELRIFRGSLQPENFSTARTPFSFVSHAASRVTKAFATRKSCTSLSRTAGLAVAGD